MASDTRARWMQAYMSRRDWAEVPAVQAEGWGRRQEPPPARRIDWLEYFLGCIGIVVVVYGLAVEYRGFLLDDEYSVVNVVALLLTRVMHLLVMMKSSPAPSSWTALALLPTCPAPALSMPPVCYEWEKPPAAATMVLPGNSGSADSNRQSHELEGDYVAAKRCFDSLLSDAAWTCDVQVDDYRAALKCFDNLLRDAARICFGWSHDAIPLTHQSDDDPPPT